MGLLLAGAAIPAFAASPDAQFAMVAAQGGLAEVQMARLALSKSRNATVTAFAQRMVADHTANNAQLASITRAEGLTVPATVDPNSQRIMMRLQALSGRAFNRAYMSTQVRAHGQMQILMQSEVNGGKDARLKAYARTTLTAVNSHLTMAKGDLAQLGGAPAGWSTNAAMGSGSMGNGSMGNGTMGSGSMGNGTTGAGTKTTGTGAPGTSTGTTPGTGSSSPMPMASPMPRPS